MTLTPEMVEIERAAFESDWRTRRPLWRNWAFDRCERWPNEYAVPTVQGSWEAWLARAQSQRAVAVAELEALQRFELREDEGNCWINWGDLRDLIDRAGGGV